MRHVRTPVHLSARQVIDRWRAASLGSGWTYPQDWWVPAVDALAKVLATGGDRLPALERLGRQRAEAGVDIAEALGDLYALHEAVDPGPVPLPEVRALALGWREASGRADATCEDPLTELVSCAYLRTRLGEVYRAAGHGAAPVPATHALVVVSLAAPAATALSWWERLSRMLLVARCLRATFCHGETLCGAGAATALVLAGRDGALPGRVAALREQLRGRLATLPEPAEARVRIARLPPRLADALALTDEFRR